MSSDSFRDDKAGAAYWDSVWNTDSLPRPFDPKSAALSDFVEQQFARYFSQVLVGRYPPGSRLLEIGCARSRWLPFFQKEFGYEVAGLDYSELGARQAQQILQAAGVDGTIVVGDLFAPPLSMAEGFDIVVSFGVAEHFHDYGGCISNMARFLAPGGMLITEIPNMGGLVGRIQKMLDRTVYDKHVPISSRELREVHINAHLTVIQSGFCMWTNWGVLNVGTWTNPRFKGWATSCIGRIAKIFWLFERNILQLPANSVTSPYIFCAAHKL